jgi:class 3 adenylate cyclase
MNTDIDVCDVLPAIRVPTLVMHRTGDRDAQVAEGRYISENIPNASFMELPGNDHLVWAGEMEDVLCPIEAFVADLDGSYELNTILATLMTVRLGSSLHGSNDLQSFIANQVDRFRGQPGETGTNVTLASFDGTGRAIRCALSIRDYCRKRDLACQIGLHVGECHREGSSVRGVPVSVSRAVANKTTAGEIMVTRMVKDLVTEFEFDDGHLSNLNEVEGQWTLYTVRG